MMTHLEIARTRLVTTLSVLCCCALLTGSLSCQATILDPNGWSTSNATSDPPAGDPSPPEGDGARPGDSDDPGDTSPENNPTNDDCVSERIDVPGDDSCYCEFDNCEATSLTCHCDVSCYGDDCLIDVDADGNASSGDDFLSDCDLSCTPEDDLSDEMLCTASDCLIQPNNVDINPTAPSAPPATSSFEAEREIDQVDVVFVIDNSGSMVDNQMAAACAIDSFSETAQAEGGSYRTGVLTTDMLGDREAPGHTYDKYTREFISAPGLVGLAGPCSTTVQCSGECNATIDLGALCDFDLGGEFVTSDTPGAEDLLRQLIVQGDIGSNYEGGLEQAFQFYAEQERQGVFDYEAPKEIVVISDEDADADLAGDYQWLCPFDSVDRNTESIPDFEPPSPTNTTASCQQDLIDFYSYYFGSRNFVVHGLLFTRDCANSSTEVTGVIYQAVSNATGGHVDSICHCEDFDDFFAEVGSSTSTLSTQMCFPGSLPDPSTIQVVFVGTNEVVPHSATNGWTLDQTLNCIVMNGAWADRYGTFRIEYVDPDAPPPPPSDPLACLPIGLDPILDTIHVFCGGEEVPASATNGWTFDPVTDCFTFHGSYVDVDGTTCTVEYL